MADAIPGLEGKTFTFFNVVAGDGIYVLTDPDDGANQLFSDLGLVVAPAVAALGTDVEGGRVQISFEQTDLLDADLMVYLGNGADVATVIPGFDDFPAVQAGAAVELSLRGHRRAEHPEPAVDPVLAGEDPPGAGGRGRLTGASRRRAIASAAWGWWRWSRSSCGGAGRTRAQPGPVLGLHRPRRSTRASRSGSSAGRRGTTSRSPPRSPTPGDFVRTQVGDPPVS